MKRADGRFYADGESAGEILRAILETEGITDSEFARMVGRNRQQIYQTINENKGMQSALFFHYMNSLGYDVVIEKRREE